MNKLDITLSSDILLIIECCKEDKNQILLEEKINSIENWDDFINLSYSHGVFPLVYDSLKKHKNIFSNDLYLKIKSINMGIVKHNMLMTSELINILKIFDKNMIEVIPFKGPVLSQLAYNNIISRQYVDLDIFIKEKDLEKAYEVLKSNEFISTLDKQFINNQLFLKKNSDIEFVNKKNVSIELHWKLFRNQFLSNINSAEIYKYINTIYINKNRIRIFQNEILLVYLCMHGSKHNWERIEWILDIDKLIKNSAYINWELVYSLSKRYSCTKMLNLGLLLSKMIFDTDIPNSLTENIKKDIYKKRISYVLNEMSNININVNKSEFHKNLEAFKFSYSLNDNLYEKVYFLKRILFELSHSDVNYLNLDKKFYFFYYLIKPFRLFGKYIIKLIK